MHSSVTLKRCTLCGEEVAVEPSTPTASGLCTHCGHLVWFHVQEADGFAILDLLPNTNLETVDVALVGEALIRSSSAPRIIVNFSLLKFVSAGSLGHLLKLQRKVQAANGTLVLCGQNQVVRQIFQATKLESLFAIAH